jgi:hypothetical protein
MRYGLTTRKGKENGWKEQRGIALRKKKSFEKM